MEQACDPNTEGAEVEGVLQTGGQHGDQTGVSGRTCPPKKMKEKKERKDGTNGNKIKYKLDSNDVASIF